MKRAYFNWKIFMQDLMENYEHFFHEGLSLIFFPKFFEGKSSNCRLGFITSHKTKHTRIANLISTAKRIIACNTLDSKRKAGFEAMNTAYLD